MTSFRRADSVRQLRQKSGNGCSSCDLNFGAHCIGLVIGVGFCIAQIAIGFTYLHSCPSQPILPVFLIVGGCVNILFSYTFRPSNLKVLGDVIFCDVRREGIILLALGIIAVCWLAVGTVFIFKTYSDTDNCNSTTTSTTVPQLNVTYTTSQNTTTPCLHCHETLLTCAYAAMIAEWCIVALLGLSLLATYCFVLIWYLKNDED